MIDRRITLRRRPAALVRWAWAARHECGIWVAAAMAFPTGYIPRDLPKKDQIKLAGNAVTPPVMTWIVGRIIHALEDRP